MRATERIGRMPVHPDALAGFLSTASYVHKIEARNTTIFHADLSCNDNGVDVIAHTALDHSLDGIAHRSHAQRSAARKIDEDDIRARAGREPAEIIAAER